ncbi:MAG TPA: 1-(5-phosphoribosyl)-5-[(5-phosphoribosylamino)methylideneamino] imidazole-4-carboxamide isomerase [Steroidobacteraceae bacterium]|nr:1-(5-phosphoribosyl)-5-[(5-phosphoribosylamino)methylideneamino] imidazole-4-carboxamide isomerase [Steroidobacteraceae bacterium]
MLLIPAIDLRDGRCVRLLQGDFAAETHYDVEPQALLERYQALGASWLHLVDLDGARDGKPGNQALVLDLAANHSVHLQVGGGIRDSATIDAFLHAGVGRVVIGSAAVTQPEQVRMWLRRFGAESITLALDVRVDPEGVPRCATHGWQVQSAMSLWQAVDAYRAEGVIHVLCTDVARDGAMTGPNVELYREAIRRFAEVEWQASGGVRAGSDLHALAVTGVAATISGRALLEQRLTAEELAPFLPNA